MSTLKKDHILGAGSAALAGGAAGAALGALVGGVPGLAVGAAAGGALGAVFGDRASEAADRREDLGHFEQIYRTMPYYVDGHSWHDYAPAYRYGLDTWERFQGQALDAVDTQLQGGWEANARFGSRLVWNDARPAVAHAWQSLDEAHARNPGTAAH
jgi:phage tail tape-measure protein